MQDVDRGIVISIDRQPAFRTSMHANTQFFGNQRSAVRADLAGEIRIDCDHLRAGIFSLEREVNCVTCFVFHTSNYIDETWLSN